MSTTLRWTGSGSNNAWANLDNWSKIGSTGTSTYPGQNSSNTDTAVFDLSDYSDKFPTITTNTTLNINIIMENESGNLLINIINNATLNLGNSINSLTNNSSNLLTIGTNGTALGGGNTLTLTGNIKIDSRIAGNSATNVTINGPGTVIYNSAPTYTGNTTISSGTLNITSTSFPSSVITLTSSASNLIFSGSITYPGTITGSGNLTSSSSCRLTGSLTGFTGNINISNGTLDINNSIPLTLSGNISGSGTLTKSVNTVLTLTGSLTGFTGNINVSNGTLEISGGTIGPSNSWDGILTIANSKKFVYKSNAVQTITSNILASSASSIDISGTGANCVLNLDGSNNIYELNLYAGTIGANHINSFGTTPLSLGNISMLGGTLKHGTGINRDFSMFFKNYSENPTVIKIDTNNNDVEYQNDLYNIESVNFGLTKLGLGTLTLDGSNASIVNDITLTAGTLSLRSTNAIGPSGTILFNGGTLQFTPSNTFDYSSRFSSAASQQYSIDTSDQNVTLATALTSNGGTLTKSGSGNLILLANNTYTGNTTINGGTLELGTSANLSGKVIVNTSGVLVFSDTNTIFDNIIEGSGQVQVTATKKATLTKTCSHTGNTTIYGGATLEIGTGGNLTATSSIINNGTLDFANNGLSFNRQITGSGNVTVSDSVQLNNTCNYTGTTTINNGTLKLNSVNLSNSSLDVNNGAILAGVGTISGNSVVKSGGTINPGLSPGTLTFADLSLGAYSITDLILYGTPYSTWDQNSIDNIVVTNNLYIDDDAIIKLGLNSTDANTLNVHSSGFSWNIFEAGNITGNTNFIDISYGSTNLDNANQWSTDYQVLLSSKIINLDYSPYNPPQPPGPIPPSPPCLTADTKVLTPNGYIRIDQLKEGDLILTDDNRKVAIKDIFTSYYESNYRTNPYIIPKHSISNNYPPEEFKLSGGHLIKYNDKWILPRTAGIFKQDEARKLVKYYHIRLENYETDNLVINGGAVVESLGDKTYADVYRARIKNLVVPLKINNKV